MSNVGKCVGGKSRLVKCLKVMGKRAAEEDPYILCRKRIDPMRTTV